MARPRIRNSNAFYLFSPWTELGWRVSRLISFDEGESKAACGQLRRVYEQGSNRLLGYQPVERPQPVYKSSDPSRAALGVRETQAIAGLMGRSRTAALNEREKQERVKAGKLRAEEDFVERVEILLAIYPASANFADIRRKRRGLAPGGDRAVRVYPKALLAEA